MTAITQATEKRINEMVKDGNKYGEALLDLLNNMKAREGWLGGSIKEMKNAGDELNNETSIETYKFDDPYFNGLSIMFPQYIDTCFCLDLHFVRVYDFNSLIKAVEKIENNGFGTF